MSDPNFDQMQEVRSQWVNWGKIGDWVKGTLVDVREMNSRLPGKEGQRVKVYELLASGGSFFAIGDNKLPVENPTEIKEGEFWTIGGRPGIDNAMRNVKIGQIVAMRFSEEVPSKTKGFNPSKIIKVYAGGMDPNYQGQTSEEVAQ